MATFKLKKRPPRAREQYRIIQNEVAREVGVVLADAVKQREMIAGEFRHHKHTFSFEVITRTGGISFRLWTSGPKAEQAGVTVWHLLSRGTDVRYAQLSDDWVSKTLPRSLDTRLGKGRVTGINKDEPQKGIEPRDWDERINEVTDGRMLIAIAKGGAAGGRKI